MSSRIAPARRRARVTVLVTVLIALGHVSPLQAQTAGPQWEAWIGCWDQIPRGTSAEDRLFGASSNITPRVCVIPAPSPAAVDIVTVVGDSIASRQRLDATGQKHEVTRDGCAGWESIQSTGTRVYLRTTLSCGGVGRLTNSVMAMSSAGDWLDVQGVAVGKNAGVRAARYRETSTSSRLPAEVAAALRGRPRGMNAARIAASGSITTVDVIEASRFLEVGVLQTWLAERGQGFDLDARQLVSLEKSGVAPSVIDVMVALSYPEVFALDRTRLGDAPPDVLGEERVVYGGEMVDDYGSGPYDYGYGRGYGWYPGRQPVRIVRQPASDGATEDEHGKVVKDRGYVSGKGDSGRSGSEKSGGGSTAKGQSGSGGSSSKGGSSGSDKESSSGRKAKPKPPG